MPALLPGASILISGCASSFFASSEALSKAALPSSWPLLSRWMIAVSRFLARQLKICAIHS
jgi:hypothetical protein